MHTWPVCAGVPRLDLVSVLEIKATIKCVVINEIEKAGETLTESFILYPRTAVVAQFFLSLAFLFPLPLSLPNDSSSGSSGNGPGNDSGRGSGGIGSIPLGALFPRAPSMTKKVATSDTRDQAIDI